MHESRIGRLTLIRRLEVAVGAGEVFGGDHRLRAAPEQFGSVGAQAEGKLVQRLYEIVVELHEHFASSHDHMVTPMVQVVPGRAAARPAPIIPLASAMDELRAW